MPDETLPPIEERKPSEAHVYLGSLTPDARWGFEHQAKRSAAWFGTTTTIHTHTSDERCPGRCDVIRGDTGADVHGTKARFQHTA